MLIVLYCKQWCGNKTIIYQSIETIARSMRCQWLFREVNGAAKWDFLCGLCIFEFNDIYWYFCIDGTNVVEPLGTRYHIMGLYSRHPTSLEMWHLLPDSCEWAETSRKSTFLSPSPHGHVPILRSLSTPPHPPGGWVSQNTEWDVWYSVRCFR